MSEQPPQRPTEAVALLDLVAKVVVVLLLAVVVVDPAWANLEGKAPLARALTYPMLAFVVPLVWAVRADPPPYPWLPDLLLTLACFTDVLGNRLDLYDTVGWFDDLVHVAVPGILTAAFLLLTGPVQGFGRALERAIAFGLSASLAWELFEYSSHVTRSTELPLAYRDTLGDLSLGWLGACIAAVLVRRGWPRATTSGRAWPPHRTATRPR